MFGYVILELHIGLVRQHLWFSSGRAVSEQKASMFCLSSFRTSVLRSLYCKIPVPAYLTRYKHCTLPGPDMNTVGWPSLCGVSDMSTGNFKMSPLAATSTA